jgi:uncharacterized membrane protein
MAVPPTSATSVLGSVGRQATTLVAMHLGLFFLSRGLTTHGVAPEAVAEVRQAPQQSPVLAARVVRLVAVAVVVEHR